MRRLWTATSLLLSASAFAQTADPTYDLLVLGGTLVTMDRSAPLIADGFIAVRDGRIAALGTRQRLPAGATAAETLDAEGRLVLPGFINTHTHSPMCLLRGVADDQSLFPWLLDRIFPLEEELVDPEFIRAGAELAALEMLRSGITAFAENYFYDDVTAEVARQAGLRVVLGFGLPASSLGEDGTVSEEQVENLRTAMRRYRDDPLVTPGLGTHSPYRTAPAILKRLRGLAEEFDVPLQIHLSETRDEVDTVRKEHGRSSTEYLDSLGFLDAHTLAAHAIWLSDADIAILAQREVKVAHCPESNQKLASGVCPVPKLLAAGVTVGLGTDGAASNNNLDFFETVNAAINQARVATLDPRALDAARGLELATVGGARCFGRDDLGALAIGKRADFSLITTGRPEVQPMYDPFSHLAYVLRSTDVETVVVDGRVVLRDRRPVGLDVAELLERVGKQRERVARSLVRRGWGQPSLLPQTQPEAMKP
ncbi:MAG TPA: amidohydrolase [Acidobacteriota bacterium]